MLALAVLSLSVSGGSASAACDACRLVTQTDPEPIAVRRTELLRQIDNLNSQARAINVQTPGLSVVLSWAGGALAPALLVWAFLRYVVSVPADVFATVGPTLLVVGLVGVGCLVTSLTFGLIWTTVMRHRRDRIVEQRQALEAELKQLPAAWHEGGAPAAWLAAWRF
jgi:hypothetical protein